MDVVSLWVGIAHFHSEAAMVSHKMWLRVIACVALVSATGIAWPLGEGLSETKEQLKLDYVVAITDHHDGRVTITLTLGDEGRLKPLNSIDLIVPGKDGTGSVDIAVSMATKNEDGKLVARCELTRELAERAEIQLRTSSLDGKQMPLTWY